MRSILQVFRYRLIADFNAGVAGVIINDNIIWLRREIMRKSFIIHFILALGLFFIMDVVPTVFAQETASNEFTLEEITVTAEKRSVNLQSVAVSVVALDASALTEMGKSTTAQILESVPNLTYRSGGNANPIGNIAIRGIQRTQESGSTNEVLPAATATYVDGVYQGIGGNYDMNRVEVLRGPQGTLYGRSATGGVVSFYTNDPKLSKFGVDASVELGTASLKNVQAAVNVPAGEKVALRAAARYYSRDGYFNAEGGKTETKEGRIKALFQPTDALGIVLSLSTQETTTWGGGWQPYLTAPDTVVTKGVGNNTPVRKGAPAKYRQASVNLNYDFGGSTLTWIGGYHDYDQSGLGAEEVKNGLGHADQTKWPTYYNHSEEIRWASNKKENITWLVGANYFENKFDTNIFSVQTSWTPPDPQLTQSNGYLAPIWGRETKGTFDNYGIFTEETFKLQDDFRVTAGLRYDKTKLTQDMLYFMNGNGTAMGNVKLPADYSGANTATLKNDKHDYNNVTYKLRFEYDVTPKNMLYFLTATGFLPGYTAISPRMGFVNGAFGLVGWDFLQLDQQKLTSYEIGTKNQFLNNTMRLNADMFYYDYAGYPEAVNTRLGNGPPLFLGIAVPLKVYGLEVEMEYLITMNDKFSLSAGYQDIKIDKLPATVTFLPMGPGGQTVPGNQALMFQKLPGSPPIKATLTYDHTFAFGDGSTLVPRAELVYTSNYYLAQMNYMMNALGEKPYNNQGSYMIGNIGATWTSANSNLSATAYVRNVADKSYKTSVQLSSNTGPPMSVTPGDPRTFGAIFSVKF
jgi:outer membrane receptor protein involved in Fe transport